MTFGKVFLVGAGPGAPDLLTIRAAEILKRAEIVFYDALVDPETIALAEHAQCIPVGKRSGRHSTAQLFINKRLVDAAKKHAVVVRLKGGDPMLFGRAHEELEALRAAGIACEVVPGVTAALAASAELGVSLTRRGLARSVVFLTPRVGKGEKPNNWARAARSADTSVIYMGAGEAQSVAAALLEEGMPESTPVVVIENASLPDAVHIKLTLRQLPGIAYFGLAGPAVILLGEVYADTGIESLAPLHAARYA